MQKLIAKFLSMPNGAYLITSAGIGSLAFAYMMQYAFNVAPCQLCIWQRVPFAVTAMLALIAVFAKPYGNHTRQLLTFCALLFLANAGLALFHSGVERHWWEWHSACTGPVLQPHHLAKAGNGFKQTLEMERRQAEEMRQALLATPVVRCDEISWSVLGLTMANLNIAYSLVLAVFAAYAARVTAVRKR